MSSSCDSLLKNRSSPGAWAGRAGRSAGSTCRILGLETARKLAGLDDADPLRLGGRVAAAVQLAPDALCLIVGGAGTPSVAILDAGPQWLILEAAPVAVDPALLRRPTGYPDVFVSQFLQERAAAPAGTDRLEVVRRALDRARFAAAGFAVSRRLLSQADLDLAMRSRPATAIRSWYCDKAG